MRTQPAWRPLEGKAVFNTADCDAGMECLHLPFRPASHAQLEYAQDWTHGRSRDLLIAAHD